MDADDEADAGVAMGGDDSDAGMTSVGEKPQKQAGQQSGREQNWGGVVVGGGPGAWDGGGVWSANGKAQRVC